MLISEHVLGRATPQLAADVGEARVMLKDRMNSHLRIVIAHLGADLQTADSDRERLQEVTEAV